MVPVVWATFRIFFDAIEMISCCDWWSWTKPGYITMTQRLNNSQWSGGIAVHPVPKYSNTKIRWKSSPSIFWDQDGILLIDCLPKGQTVNAEYYWSLLVQLNDILKDKRRGKVTKGVLFLHDNTPHHRALATQKKLAYMGFQCLDHRIWPRRTTTCSVDWKNNWKVAIFLLTRSLLPRRPDWTDNLLIFSWVTCKT